MTASHCRKHKIYCLSHSSDFWILRTNSPLKQSICLDVAVWVPWRTNAWLATKSLFLQRLKSKGQVSMKQQQDAKDNGDNDDDDDNNNNNDEKT